MDMDPEIGNFIRVWTAAILCQCYTYFVVSRIPSGVLRLLSTLPVVYLFVTLPLSLHSFHLGAGSIFYLVWLANFKLILFSFDAGPLSSPSLSLSHFVAISLFPIKPKSELAPVEGKAVEKDASGGRSDRGTVFVKAVNSFDKSTTFEKKKKSSDPDIERRRRNFRMRRLLIKIVILAIILRLYKYREKMSPRIIMTLYNIHMYLGVEFLLALTAIPVKAVTGLELARQFNEPYLSSSLQDFWGRRWNLVVTGLLRQTVYNPLRRLFTPLFGWYWVRVPATLVTFLISGLMHELLFYYLIRSKPSWEVTWFFVVQGVFLTAEVYVKKWVAGRWRLPRAASTALTLLFVGFTGGWLFFPPMVRHGLDLMVIDEECSVLLHFFRFS